MKLDFLDIPTDNVEMQEEVDQLRNPSFMLPPVAQVWLIDHALMVHIWSTIISSSLVISWKKCGTTQKPLRSFTLHMELQLYHSFFRRELLSQWIHVPLKETTLVIILLQHY